MNQEQVDVLNIVHQTLKYMLVSIAACNPQQKDELAANLLAAAQHPKADPAASKMLQGLAQGLMLDAPPENPKH